MHRLRMLAIGASLLMAGAGLLLPQVAGQAAPGGTRFVNFELAATPPQPAGTVCPGSGTRCWNYAAEPAIRSAPDGTLYGSSENGLGGGTDAWKSTDGGLHYASLLSPNGLSQSNDSGFAPGGGDTDLAVATAKNGAGLYNVYVSSLSLADVDVSTSPDGGKTWALNPTGAQVPVDDRPWIAAEGASKVCISYHDVATFNIDVDCSYDAGATFTQHAVPGAIDPAHAFLIDSNAIGNLAIDPASHVVYQTFSGPADLAGTTACGGFACLNVVWMAVSTDGGMTFTDYKVYENPDQNVSYGHQFVNVSVDRAGNVYSVYTDNHIVSYSFSSDQGKTWHGPFTVSKTPANTAIFPWSVAGSAGKLDIVYYGTSYYDGKNPPDSYPSTAAWYVYMAQNLTALKPGSSFSQVAASPIVHFGGVCEGGISCTGNRDLYDDFGVAASPVTGFASIIYSDDQYTNDPNDPPQPGCTPARSNSISCDHTSIATQTSGRGIFG